MMNYWAKRIDEQNKRLYDGEVNKINRLLREQYRITANRIINDIADLYETIKQEAVEGEIKPNDLYRYNRYFELMNEVNKQLVALGEKEVKIYRRDFETLFDAVQDNLTMNAPRVLNNVMPVEAQPVIDAVWCADGKHWSQRVWGNKELLQERLERGLMDCVARGVPKAELVKTLKRDFSVGYEEAERLTRTELCFVQSEACAKRYESAGIEYFEVLEAMDDRTCELCRGMNGKRFRLSEMKIGVNAPPFHPNDRGTIIPVIEG